MYPLTVRAWLDFRAGRWDAALAGVSEAVQLAVDTDQRVPLGGALSVRATIRAARGDADGCRDDAARVPEGFNSILVESYAHSALGLLALGEADIDGAIEHLARALAATEAAGNREPGARYQVYDLIEAHVRAGNTAEAEALLARQAPGERRLPGAAAKRCAGLLSDDFEPPFAAALELHDGLPLPFERARTLLCLGERRRRARRLREARDPLREAMNVFDRLGAEPWSRRARAELRATGASVPVRTPLVFTELTAHELQVAQLAGEGRTNREIAAALFIAPKTVEHHLTRIFRKLGLRRRAELARVAGELRAPAPA